MAKDNTKKFTAEMLMDAMEKHQSITEWNSYAIAIDTEVSAAGCPPLFVGDDPKRMYPHLPKRLGQIQKAYERAGFPCPPFPARPKKPQETTRETMEDIIRRRMKAKEG